MNLSSKSYRSSSWITSVGPLGFCSGISSRVTSKCFKIFFQRSLENSCRSFHEKSILSFSGYFFWSSINFSEYSFLCFLGNSIGNPIKIVELLHEFLRECLHEFHQKLLPEFKQESSGDFSENNVMCFFGNPVRHIVKIVTFLHEFVREWLHEFHQKLLRELQQDNFRELFQSFSRTFLSFRSSSGFFQKFLRQFHRMWIREFFRKLLSLACLKIHEDVFLGFPWRTFWISAENPFWKFHWKIFQKCL